MNAQELAIELGRRYERLLFLTVPISLASLAVLFFAVASNVQEERIAARCSAAFANSLVKNQKQLEELRAQAADGDSSARLPYAIELGRLSIYDLPSDCPTSVVSTYENSKLEVTEFIKKLRAVAELPNSKPLNFYGIQIPEKAVVGLLGTNVTISLARVDQVLKIALAPILFLWLGSLYNTRYRESLLIGQAVSLFQVFPHVINVYPVAPVSSLKKRSKFGYYAPHITRFLFFFVRALLVAIFVIPPTAAYVMGLILAPYTSSLFVTAAVGGLISISCLMTLIVESLPWHYRRIFSAPELEWNTFQVG